MALYYTTLVHLSICHGSACPAHQLPDPDLLTESCLSDVLVNGPRPWARSPSLIVRVYSSPLPITRLASTASRAARRFVRSLLLRLLGLLLHQLHQLLQLLQVHIRWHRSTRCRIAIRSVRILVRTRCPAERGASVELCWSGIVLDPLRL
jgi:hypothetical protein